MIYKNKYNQNASNISNGDLKILVKARGVFPSLTRFILQFGIF
jgi:hypothetical protein